MAVYFATKAYVTSFTEALAQELSGTEITATVICPGATATKYVGLRFRFSPARSPAHSPLLLLNVPSFAEVAGNKNSFVFKSGNVMTAEEVARTSYRAWMLGEPVRTRVHHRCIQLTRAHADNTHHVLAHQVYVTGVANSAPLYLLPFFPRALLCKLIAFITSTH
jgi:short-subunit dehydrogenase